MSDRVTRSKRKDQSIACSTADTCSICLDSMSKMDPFKLPCGHSFHATCIMKNVVTSNLLCPLCRAPFGKKQRQEEEYEEEEYEEGALEEQQDIEVRFNIRDSNDGYDEDQVQEVADRLESKLLPTDVDLLLGRFRILTDTTAMSARDKIELLSEQITHVTDDEEED